MVRNFLNYVNAINDEIEGTCIGMQEEGRDDFLDYLDPSTFTSEQMQNYLDDISHANGFFYWLSFFVQEDDTISLPPAVYYEV